MVDESSNDNFGAPRDEVISVADVITDLVADTAITRHLSTGSAKFSQGLRAIEFRSNRYSRCVSNRKGG